MNNQSNQQKDWRKELVAWLQQHPRTMPDDLRQLRADFLQRFPSETLHEMTLEQYAGGKPDGFCYWLETKTRKLGSIHGGSSAKFGIYLGRSDGQWHYNKIYSSPEDALTKLRDGLVALVKAVQDGEDDKLDSIGAKLLGPNRYVLRSKPLYLYFPDTFLPCFSMEHFKHFCAFFGKPFLGDLLTLNRRLLAYVQSLPEFTGFDTQQIMAFLYDCFPPPSPTPQTVIQTEPETLSDPEEESETLSKELQQLTNLVQYTRNILLYGPPGTGKTYVVQEFARRFLSGQAQKTWSDYYTLVTFHQSFAYEEFVEGLKPQLHREVTQQSVGETGSTMEYAIVPGIFKRICMQAEGDWQQGADTAPKYLLVIDEINRANIAKVFGELITLIEDDKRLGQAHELVVHLPYSGQRFGVPPNLYIIGTMNTADRSIALLDLALRRRFTFMEVMPDAALLTAQVDDVDLAKLLTRLNQRISALLDRDHQIGHSYLLNVDDMHSLRFAWYHRIIPLLQEYFYHDAERLRMVIGKEFVSIVPPEAQLFDTGNGSFDSDRPHYTIHLFEENDADFLAALKRVSGQ